MTELITLLTIALALVWLAREIWVFDKLWHMPVVIPDTLKRVAWANLKALAESMPDKQQPFWLRHPESMEPLCGTEWLESTMHVIPEYHFEIHAWGVRHTINLKTADSKILREIASVTMKPNREQRKGLTAQRKAVRVARAY